MKPGYGDEYYLNSSGYFHWPAVWVGSSLMLDGEVDVRRLKDVVHREILSCGVEVKVSRDGLFAFRFSDWEPGRYPTIGERLGTGLEFDAAELRAQRVELFDAHLACLYTALWRLQDSTLKRMIVSPDEVVRIKLLDDPEHITADERFYSLLEARIPSFERWRPPPEIDWRFARVMTIEPDTVADSFKLLDRVLAHPESGALALADLYARAATYHEERNHDVCLITAWAVVERLLNRLWDEHLDEGGEGSPSGRRPTAQQMIDVLTEAERLPPGLHEGISAVRRARNGWIHVLEPVDRDHSGKAIRVAEALIARCLDIRFAVPLEPGQRYEEYDCG